MKTLLFAFRGALAFLKALVRPKDAAVALSPNGHAILKGWESSPEEALIRLVHENLPQERAKPRVGLYCYEGPHQGELLTFTRPLEHLGAEIENSRVLTPAPGTPPFSYQMVLNGTMSLTSEPGSLLKVNGVEALESKIFDYDEVNLAGNQCVVLDLTHLGGYEQTS